MIQRPLTILPFCLLAALLLSCGESTPPYTLTAVLPTPVTPGAEVTVYGTFPADSSLTLNAEAVVGQPVAGGVQLTVPEWVVAGSLPITVQANKQTLQGSVQVQPRIDSVSLEGQQLTVQGAGWPSQADSSVKVNLEVAGRTLEPTLSTGLLTATLPPNLTYGSLNVRVVVNEVVSEARSLVREASSVSGKVVFPEAAEPTVSSQARLEPTITSLLTSIIVFYAEDLTEVQFEGLESVTSLPTINASKLSFATPAQAQIAYQQLINDGFTLEYDLPVHTDGLTSLQADTPSAPGTGQWHLPLLGLEQAWTKTKGEGVVVAVLDTGVRLDHPDLIANLLPGYDFVEKDAEPYDLAGHGTHVAGLVAASGQVLGTAPDAKLLPVRVLEGTAGGSAFTVAEGILWAAGLMDEPANPHPAQILNLSLGMTSYSEVIARSITQAQDVGVIVVAAAGNSGGPVAYPAALPDVISVTSLAGPTLAYQPWYANKGRGLWLTGYGGDITQDQDKDGADDGILSTDLYGYGYRMGTSMAAPQVAGLAALALASGTPAALMRDTLASTATELGVGGYDASFGYGLATGRSATPSDPRSYVVALEGDTVLGWTLVQADGSFTLSNLPPGRAIALVAASDEDGDSVLAETSELVSAPLALSPSISSATDVTLSMTVSDGSATHTLEVSP